ncbi:RNI-like protein [Gigaspora margarita]|uniref:RNI-like protein n=1 Tax=Gigaspora margarita TaxID=4874 RepID=A0A8H4ANX6_GIGMA|nr:RNI-like protein [Gigaspora margarita]
MMSFTFAGDGLVPNVSLNVIKLESSIAQNGLNNNDSSDDDDDDDDDDGDKSIGQLLRNVPNPRVINAPPLAHGQFPPNMLARPFPFTGTGFRLTNNQPILQQQDSDDDFDDEEKRQRIAEAVQARVHADNSVNDSQHVKHGIKREVKTLKSRCA